MNPSQRQQGPGHAIFALAVAFVRFRFTDNITKLRAHLRALPRDEGRPARLSLALVAILVLATPVLAGLLNVGGSLFLLEPLNNVSRGLLQMAIEHSWGP